MKESTTRTTAVMCVLAWLVAGWIFLTPRNSGAADTPANLPPTVQEVVDLTKARIQEDIILKYIKGNGATFTLTADQIIYLNAQGVSQPVIAALETKSAGSAATPSSNTPPSGPAGPQDYAPAPVAASATVPSGAPAGETAPEADELNFAYFKAELGPYGEWVDIPGNSPCWVPAEIKMNPDWKPYVDKGKWTYTDKGWSWSSEYPWGEIVFHYGRWFEHPTYRWVWKPGFEWAPAWVVWRKGEPDKPVAVVALRPADPPPPPTEAPTVEQMKASQLPFTPPPPVPPQAEEMRVAATERITFQYFHDQLAPFGTWVEVSGIGPCWYPNKVIAANPDWRPYYDSGRWVETDNGLFWASDYTWGDIPFHYGRWIQDPSYGWLWVPGYNWGPAWVAWRDADANGCIGWAPLPYGAVWIDGGWRFQGRAVVDVGFDFGLGEASFVFVGYDHFHEAFPHRLRAHYNEYRFNIARERVHQIYGKSAMRNEFTHDEHGRVVNHGLGTQRMERITHGQVERASFKERSPVGDRAKPEPPRKGNPNGSIGDKRPPATPIFRPPAPQSSQRPTVVKKR